MGVKLTREYGNAHRNMRMSLSSLAEGGRAEEEGSIPGDAGWAHVCVFVLFSWAGLKTVGPVDLYGHHVLISRTCSYADIIC